MSSPLQIPIQWLRSKIPGRRPGDGVMRQVLDGEPFLNQADAVLCWLDGTGALRVTPLADLAQLTSPAFKGTPTAPIAALGDNSTTIATTAFVVRAVAALVNGSPAQLDTLKELADALGDDGNFAATMTAALAVRVRVDAAQGLTAAQKAQALANIGAQAALGFAAVQQGTGIGQSAGNLIKIGHSPQGPKLTVDTTDFGRVWLDRAASVSGNANQWLVVFPNGYARQGGFTNGEKQITFTNAFTTVYSVDAKIIGTQNPYQTFDVNIENLTETGFVARPRYNTGSGVGQATQNYLWAAEGYIAQ